MAGLNVESLKRKFQLLNNTQDSIQTLSLWIIHHKNHYREIMQLWIEHLKEAKAPVRLTLFYLANDIIQNSKRKGATVFLDSFADVLEEAATFCREEPIREKVLRIFKIWNERNIYTDEFCEKLQKATVSQKPPKPKPRVDTKLLVDFDHNEVPVVIEQLARFEGEVELKYRQLGMLNVDVANTETIMQLKASQELAGKLNLHYKGNCEDESAVYLKTHCCIFADRAGGKRFSQQFEDSAIKLEDYVTSLTKEVELRRKLLELLQKSEMFYEAQYGEANIVANAYKNFGMRVASLKKRLEEHKALLPDSFSPIPSPTIDAPSPGATPPRDPNSDSIEVEDMELSDEDDKKEASIIAVSSVGSRRPSRRAATRSKIAASTTSTSGISHISTITGAGSHGAFKQQQLNYLPFSSQSPPAVYSTADDYRPIPNALTHLHNSTNKKEPQEENYTTIKDRLLQVMHDAPKLPASVKLFDSPARQVAKSSPKPSPVSVASSTPSPKSYPQQVSPIITVPPAVPAPVQPQVSAVASPPRDYDPFENAYSAEVQGQQESYYSQTVNIPAPPVQPPAQDAPSPPDEDVYDPEMVDYLLEMPLAKKSKPQTSCIIPLAGGFQSPKTTPGSQQKVDPTTPGKYPTDKSTSVVSSKENTSISTVETSTGVDLTNNNKRGGTPLRDECSTPPSQEDSPMLKEATANPIEFLTKIITSSRQSSSAKAPSTSFLSSLSLLTQTVQNTSQQEKSDESASAKSFESPRISETRTTDKEQDAAQQNNVGSGSAKPFCIGAFISDIKQDSGPNPSTAKAIGNSAQVQKMTAPSSIGSSVTTASTRQNARQMHASAGSRAPVPFSIGALVSSFKEDSNPSRVPASTPPSNIKGSSFTAAIYQKPNKVPLCQTVYTPGPSTLASIKSFEAPLTTSAPVNITDDSTNNGNQSSLMARLMQHKSKAQPVLSASVLSSIVSSTQSQPPGFPSIILEPPPPPPTEKPADDSKSVPLPTPVDGIELPVQPSSNVPPPPNGPPPRGPPQTGLPPLPLNPPPHSGPHPPPHSGPPPPTHSGPPPPPHSGPPPPPHSGPPPPPSDPPPPPSGPPPPPSSPPPPPSGPPPPPSGPPPPPSGPPPPPSGPPPPQPPRCLPPAPPSSLRTGPPQPPSGPSQLKIHHPHTSQHPQPSNKASGPHIPQSTPVDSGLHLADSQQQPPSPVSLTSPVPPISPGIRNQSSKTLGRVPPPPPGPPPPNAKRGGVRLSESHSLKTDAEEDSSTITVEANLEVSLSEKGEPHISPPISPLKPALQEQNKPEVCSQPSSPIPVVRSSSERNISVLGQSHSAKSMWEKAPIPSRSPGVASQYSEFPKRPIEKFDYSHSRPIETLERQRLSYAERFHGDHSKRDSLQSSERRYESVGERYTPPFSKRDYGQDRGFNISMGREYSGRIHEYRHEYEEDRGLGYHTERGLDFGRERTHPEWSRPQDHISSRSYSSSDYRSTQQLIEKELSVLEDDLEPRGAPISTLERRLDRRRHASEFIPHMRDAPYWRGPNNHPGPPVWGRRPPHFRY